MTRILVNDREVEAPAGGILSLEQIVRYVEQTHLAGDAVIRGVRVDGIPLAPGGSACPVARETVEIATGRLREAVCDSIEEAISYLDRIEALIPSLASSLRVSAGAEAFEKLRHLYDGFYWLNLLVRRLESAVGMTLDQIRDCDVPAREHQQKLVSVLEMMVAAHESRAFARLADLLDQEIVPVLPVWKRIFRAFAESVSTCP